MISSVDNRERDFVTPRLFVPRSTEFCWPLITSSQARHYKSRGVRQNIPVKSMITSAGNVPSRLYRLPTSVRKSCGGASGSERHWLRAFASIIECLDYPAASRPPYFPAFPPSPGKLDNSACSVISVE